MEKRIIELETRLAYEEHLLEQINDVVATQGRQIERLERQVLWLAEKMGRAGLLEPGDLPLRPPSRS